MRDGRYVIVSIPAEQLLDFFGRREPRFRVILPDLPVDYEVAAVHFSFEKQLLQLLVHSDSFEPIRPGYEFPWLGPATIERIPEAVR
jgi:hypothetical protein